MNPRRRVQLRAWSLSLVLLACLAGVSHAQLAENARTPLELFNEPLVRSARLLGMGRLTLLDDRNNRIDLWDFAANPAGLFDTDTVSVLDVRPSTISTSSARDFTGDFGAGELQDHASRDSRLSIEAIRRPRGGTAYGLLAEVTQLRNDDLYSVNSERRSLLSNPLAIPVISGRLPFFDRERMRYTLSGIFGLEDTREEYRRLHVNGTGAYVDHSGTLIGPPDYFTPDETFVRRMGGGLAVSYRPGSVLQMALSGRFTTNEIEGANEGERYASEHRERRPIYSGQGTVIARLGANAEAGLDAQVWTASSKTTWVFTLSPSGGPGPSRPPLAGRGDLLERDESGSSLRLRGRYVAGATEVGGSVGMLSRDVKITPTPLASTTSFNLFRYNVYSQVSAADTLAIPEDVLSSDVQQTDFEGAAGISRRLFRDRAVAGVEFHYVKREVEALTGQGAVAEEINGLAPIASALEASGWDVRGGAEYRCTQVLLGRLGYIFRSFDRDRNTEANEFVSHTLSAGLGIRPAGARWTFDLGYGFEWGLADYGAPEVPRLTGQQLGAQVRWDF